MEVSKKEILLFNANDNTNVFFFSIKYSSGSCRFQENIPDMTGGRTFKTTLFTELFVHLSGSE